MGTLLMELELKWWRMSKMKKLAKNFVKRMMNVNFLPTTFKRSSVGFKQELLPLQKLHAGMVIVDVDQNFVQLNKLFISHFHIWYHKFEHWFNKNCMPFCTIYVPKLNFQFESITYMHVIQDFALMLRSNSSQMLTFNF